MSYAQGRIIQDADSHIFESPEFYDEFYEAAIRDRVPSIYAASTGFSEDDFAKAKARHVDPEFASTREPQLMQRKLWDAMGAFQREDRSRTLDLLGFSRQIVYDSFMRLLLRELELGDDMDLLYSMARAHVRALVNFCGDDPRMVAAGYVPLADPERSIEAMRFAIESGCKAVTMAVDCPKNHSPSHVALEPMWAMAAEAGVPIIYHLGGGRRISETFMINGRRSDKGYSGGDGTMTSIQYLGAPIPVMETLNALIVDGVLDRHPKLRFGLIEYGADWLPGWMRFLDTAMYAYRKTEGRLQQLSLPLSEYVRRQIRVSPFHFEHTGWIIREAGPEVLLFSSDYPHMEGGRDPIAKFDASLDQYDISMADRDRFYTGNFDDLMGGTTAPALRAPAVMAQAG